MYCLIKTPKTNYYRMSDEPDDLNGVINGAHTYRAIGSLKK